MTPNNKIEEIVKGIAMNCFSWNAEEGKSWMEYDDNQTPLDILDSIRNGLQQLSDAKDAEHREERNKEYFRGLGKGERNGKAEVYRVADKLCEYFGLDKETKWSNEAVDLLIQKHKEKVEVAYRSGRNDYEDTRMLKFNQK